MARTLSLARKLRLNAARFHVVPAMHKPNEAMHLSTCGRVGAWRPCVGGYVDWSCLKGPGSFGT